jgi:hypothetical protein
MAAQVDGVVGNHDQVECPRRYREITPGAQVLLEGLVGLNRADGYVEKRAHAITASVAASAMTTITMSNADFSFSRNGLKPTLKR